MAPRAKVADEANDVKALGIHMLRLIRVATL